MALNHEQLAALEAAAQKKGAPLTAIEREKVIRTNGRDRAYWQARFENVIRLAGYRGDAPRRICAEHLDDYMTNMPQFIAMLESYERSNGDPD